MAAKKKAAAPAKADKVSDTPKEGGKVVAPVETDARLVAGQEIAAETDLRNAREEAVKVERNDVAPDADGDIDERMAALLADHIEMGVRKG